MPVRLFYQLYSFCLIIHHTDAILHVSRELMQEKAYDSKSDIWSLGCLIYELCAHQPPFHEAKTHSRLLDASAH